MTTTGARLEFRRPGLGRKPEPGTIEETYARHVIVRADSDGTTHKVLASKTATIGTHRAKKHEGMEREAAPVTEAEIRRVRLVSTINGGGVAVPKPRKPVECERFKRWVKTHPCCNPRCQRPAPSDPHHFGKRGISQLVDDLRCVPACRGCHTAVTNSEPLPGLTAWETKLLFLEQNVTLIIAWFTREGR